MSTQGEGGPEDRRAASGETCLAHSRISDFQPRGLGQNALPLCSCGFLLQQLEQTDPHPQSTEVTPPQLPVLAPPVL